MKKINIKNKEFIRNIIIVVLALLIIEKIVDIAPGYKREKESTETKLIINEKDVTEELKQPIYINEKNTIYLSEEDVRELIDETIIYDEKYESIVTTTNTKVASAKINENKIKINETEKEILDAVIMVNQVRYIPISEMELVYNIEVKYIEEKNRVIIDDLSRGMIVANISKDTKVKYKQRALSKDVCDLQAGTKVYCFYTTSKGWREIRTEDGTLGYVKANELTNEYILRQDMDLRQNAKQIKKYNTKESFYVDGQEAIVKNFSELSENQEEKYDVWIEITNDQLKDETNQIIGDYELRTKLIDNFINSIIKYNIKCVNINFNDIENPEDFQRFIIELAPKLRELGIKTSVKINSGMNKKDFEKYVEYVV